jgi:hypothetical protein
MLKEDRGTDMLNGRPACPQAAAEPLPDMGGPAASGDAGLHLHLDSGAYCIAILSRRIEPYSLSP